MIAESRKRRGVEPFANQLEDAIISLTTVRFLIHVETRIAEQHHEHHDTETPPAREDRATSGQQQGARRTDE